MYSSKFLVNKDLTRTASTIQGDHNVVVEVL